MYILLPFIFGLVLGSFANVCIWRLPRDKSIIKPPSCCPNCMKNIPWYYNIPVLSYIILGGKCANCGVSIAVRYPIVELLTAILTGWWFFKFGITGTAFIFTVLGLFLIIVSWIDLEFQIIPTQLTYPLIIIGLIASPFNYLISYSIINSLIGLAGGGGAVLIVRWLGGMIFKKEAMGLGDVKLMMAIGAFIGITGVFWTLFLGSALGSIIGIFLRVTGKKDKLDYIPFGPFLSTGAVIYISSYTFLNRFLVI